jgi:hypothetical protein
LVLLVLLLFLHNNVLIWLGLWFRVLRNYRRLVVARLGAGLASAEVLLRRSRGVLRLRVLVAMLPSGASFGRAKQDHVRGSCQRRAKLPRFGAHK